MYTFGLIGYPLGHSFSRRYFSEKFEKENINAQYLNFEIDCIEKLPDVITSTPDLKGLNVTIPYKQQVINYLDEIDDTAKEIGAVNVIQIKYSNGRKIFKGYNSDIIGFTKSISPLIKPNHNEALILGTGGASKAVNAGLRSLGLTPIHVSRNPQSDDILSYAELTPELINRYTVIVNTTPLGMYPNVDTCPPIPYDSITNNHLLYDLVYNPIETMFMKSGMKNGAIVKNGIEMLELQALAAWDIWNMNEK